MVPDLLGYGYSERPDVPYTREFYTRQLRELLDGLGVRTPVHVVGASLGGAIATAFTAENPGRAGGLPRAHGAQRRRPLGRRRAGADLAGGRRLALPRRRAVAGAKHDRRRLPARPRACRDGRVDGRADPLRRDRRRHPRHRPQLRLHLAAGRLPGGRALRHPGVRGLGDRRHGQPVPAVGPGPAVDPAPGPVLLAGAGARHHLRAGRRGARPGRAVPARCRGAVVND
ncbi:alpha/beta fold hydrolase [Amycolatopsis sp. NPDC051061]|uniref:alpha/beta fold hydrolase n=1 Tax=Amycolatopsis sp. NPDC051061 TaxID=3155042 RepID=UPI003442C3C5